MIEQGVSLARKFNLGNYESMEVSISALLTEGEKAEDVWKALDAKVIAYAKSVIPSQPQATQPPPTQNKPQTAPASPTPFKRVSTSKPVSSYNAVKPKDNAPAPAVLLKTKEDLAEMFNPELRARLEYYYSTDGIYLCAKPKSFLGSENFATVAKTFRENGGEYISAGKDSYFRIPRAK